MSDVEKCKKRVVKPFKKRMISMAQAFVYANKDLTEKQKKAKVKEIEKNADKRFKYALLAKEHSMCNKNKCKETLFEEGDPKKLPPSFLKFINKRYAKDPLMKKFFTEGSLRVRKNIFGKEKNVVDEEGFYNKLSKEDVDYIKSIGGLSGCTDFVMNPNNKSKTAKKTLNKNVKKTLSIFNKIIKMRTKKNKTIKNKTKKTKSTKK